MTETKDGRSLTSEVSHIHTYVFPLNARTRDMTVVVTVKLAFFLQIQLNNNTWLLIGATGGFTLLFRSTEIGITRSNWDSYGC